MYPSFCKRFFKSFKIWILNRLERFRLTGFTLIEMLVALAILSIIGVVGIGALRGFSHSLRITRVNEDELRNLRWFFEMLDVELSSSVLYRNSEFTMFESKREDMGGIEVSNLRFSFIMPQRYLELGQRGEIVVVEYRVKQEPDGKGLVLTKKAIFNPYSPESSQLETYVLLSNIEGFELRFRDGGKWVKDWDSRSKQDVPDAVELKLQIGLKKYIEYFNIFPSTL